MTHGTSPRGSYAVGRERRERILDAASERFAEAGYSATSLAEIARAADLTTPGLTHHFPTKQHLLLAIVERRFDIAAQIAEASDDTLDGGRVLRLLLRLSSRFAADPLVIELFVRVSAETTDRANPARTLFTERYERVVGDIAALFAEEVEVGALRADVDYRAVARECIAVSDGLQLQWVVTGGSIDLVALTRAHLERLLPTILAPGGDRPDLSSATTSACAPSRGPRRQSARRTAVDAQQASHRDDRRGD